MWRPRRRSLFAVSLAGFLGLAGCRQDMHNQPRYKPLAATDFFGDGRSARPVVEGTVARGQLRIDKARYTGKVDGMDVAEFPFSITRTDLLRGQQRFNIYCSPCHSRVGDGNGMVVRRGFRQAASYHTDKLIKAPVGHFFDVMTNGFGAMPEYASQIPPHDRWSIVAYIRALQLSQEATMSDVPPGQRVPSELPTFRGDPGSGATLPELQSASPDEKGEQPK